MINIKSLGAIGDGVADDTHAFQTALTERLSIDIPVGRYLITSTLSSPSDKPPSGIKWIGDGRSVSDVLAVDRHGSGAALLWGGAAGGTMLDLPSASGFVFEGLTFCGKPTATTTARAGKLIHMGLVTGYGSGSHSFREVDFQHADIAVQVMDLQADVNGDTCAFEHVFFFDCDTGLLTKNDQALGFRFSDLYAYACRNVINMERGGMLSVDTANFTACGGPDAANDYCIRIQSAAQNTHCSVFSNIRAEEGTKGVAQLVGYGKFEFVGFSEAQLNQNCRQFDLRGPLVIFRGGRIATQNATTRPFKITRHVGGFRTGTIFDGFNFSATTAFSPPDWFEIDPNSSPVYALRSCTVGPADAPTPDMASQPQWGRVVHFLQTTDGVQHSPYLDGAASAGNTNCIVIPTDTAWMFDVTIIGKEHAGSRYASFKRRATVINVGGTLTLGSVQTIGCDDNGPGWACGLSVVSTFLRSFVTGAVGVTIDWKASFVGHQAG